jgi:1-acyl-sn-glycerol-3-phosphate acyltransferase
MAVEQQLPVLPLTLLGTREILPADTLFLSPGRAKIVVHEPIFPEGHDARSLMNASRDAIATALPAEFR